MPENAPSEERRDERTSVRRAILAPPAPPAQASLPISIYNRDDSAVSSEQRLSIHLQGVAFPLDIVSGIRTNINKAHKIEALTSFLSNTLKTNAANFDGFPKGKNC